MSGDHLNDAERKKRSIGKIIVSLLMFVAMVAAVSVGVTSGLKQRAREAHSPPVEGHGGEEGGGSGGNEGHGDNKGGGENKGGAGGGDHHKMAQSHKAVQSICNPTDYKRLCKRTLGNANSTDPRDLIQAEFHAATEKIKEVMKNLSSIKPAKDDLRTDGALKTCHEVMEYAIGDLHRSTEQMSKFEQGKLDEYVENMRIWLSGAINFQETCIDAFENTTGKTGEHVKKSLNNSQVLTSNGLAMATQLVKSLKSLNNSTLGDIKRLLYEGKGEEKATERHPRWINARERKLLESSRAQVKANVVVAKDGSGKYKTITEALKQAPTADPNKLDAIAHNKTTFVIHIKEGIYEEEVRVERNMTHVMFIGDGPTKTRITGKKSFADGYVAYKTPTVSIMGSNFIAKDIAFENSAGPDKGKALALMVQSDMAVFYNCQIDGYGETLNAHSYRQYYRDCSISGTMDIIHGDAAAVFQNCKLVIRKPVRGQDQCVVTAQARTDHKEATAIVLHNCTIESEPQALPKCKAYLGRPAKKYSKVIILQSYIDDSIAPEGWLPWMGNFGQETCTFVEYENRGPGAMESGRVRWPSIKKIPLQEAVEFTPGKFIGGDIWIPQTHVPYKSGLIHV